TGPCPLKRMQDMSKDSDLCYLHATPSLGNKKYFVTFIDDASRFCHVYLLHTKDEALGLSQGFWGEAMFYVIEPNESVLINSIIELRDVIFDENRFSSVLRPSLRIPSGTEDVSGSVVPRKVIEEDDPKTLDEAINSQYVAFWKEAINDEMDSIIGNNTWVLADLPSGCKPLGCKWIFKRKLKVDGTIEKFKAMLVIQSFKQKSVIDYFDTYAPMDVKTAFLNGELDEEIYMNQPQGFILLRNENKVCKLIKSLYGLKKAPKQWHQNFDEVVLSDGYLLNQAGKCVYRKFDKSGKGVIICLYVDDMLIFGTNQVQVDLTKEFLSSKFSMKDMGEADVILVGKLSRYTSNPGTQHWQAIQQVLKYLKKTMDYSLTYIGYLSVLEGYNDASWISNTEDNSSTSGWVFLLGGGAISWASNK
ncbi:zinc finger, CCHC-type containing protein, partial [Tanacetum coccineum]